MPTPTTPTDPHSRSSTDRCLICLQLGGSHPGDWHLPTCKMLKRPKKASRHPDEFFWDDLVKSLNEPLRRESR